MNTSEIKVLEALDAYYLDGALYSRGIVEITGLQMLQVRRAVKSLVRRGYAELQRGLFDDDGRVAGSGYACTLEGHVALRALQE